jgi:hypothetical protein
VAGFPSLVKREIGTLRRHREHALFVGPSVYLKLSRRDDAQD